MTKPGSPSTIIRRSSPTTGRRGARRGAPEPDQPAGAREGRSMSDATCEHPGCGRPAFRACDRCRRSFCSRHVEPLYPDVAPERSPWRCKLCTREVREEARQHRRRPKRNLVWAGLLVLAGFVLYIVGTALAPDSDEVTFAALAGLGLVGIGAITFVYGLLGSR